MHGSDPALPLCAAAIGLALFLYGFGSGGKRNGSFRVITLLIGLAGAGIFIAGLAALESGAPSGA